MKQKFITIEASVYEAVKNQIGAAVPERGGLIGGDVEKLVVSHFHFDTKGNCSAATYSPHTTTLNELLEQWNKDGTHLLGCIHSHPRGFLQPSGGDEIYARAILEANPELPTLLVPIVQSGVDGGNFELKMFIAERQDKGVKINPAPFRIKDGSRISTEYDYQLFSRVTTAYDLERLAAARVIWVGTGSGSAACEDLARAGVGEFVLIDPGIIEPCNLATQNYYRYEIGRAKVQSLARRLRSINRKIKVTAIQSRLQEIDDETFKRLAFEPLPTLFRGKTKSPAITVLVGGTDDFYAQARIHRLSLHFGLPSVCCQTYLNAFAGEITFVDQRTVTACHRCILSSRYQAYLEENYQNVVGSSGSPITATTRLNALTSTIVLAIMHHQTATKHPYWGDLLERIGNRNLALVRCHPDVQKHLGIQQFEIALAGKPGDHFFCDETIWRTQQPENTDNGNARPCPDCLGLGNLALRKGAFSDTRQIER